MKCRGIRGATTADANTKKCIFEATKELLQEMFQANSVDKDEWAAAEGQKTAIAKGCSSSTSSWCPCQNNPDDPECQK